MDLATALLPARKHTSQSHQLSMHFRILIVALLSAAVSAEISNTAVDCSNCFRNVLSRPLCKGANFGDSATFSPRCACAIISAAASCQARACQLLIPNFEVRCVEDNAGNLGHKVSIAGIAIAIAVAAVQVSQIGRASCRERVL